MLSIINLMISFLFTEPINIFQTLHKSEKVNVPVRLSYHRGVHYNSLVDPHKATVGVGLGKTIYKHILKMYNANAYL